MSAIQDIDAQLQEAVMRCRKKQTAYKTGPGDYAEHEQFLGVNAPTLQTIAKKYPQLPLADLHILLQSPFNEKRALALRILVLQYRKANPETQEKLYQFYMATLPYINNWGLVDISAHRIVGAYLLHRDKEILTTLARSEVLWRRRIAIVATWWFIRNNNLEPTFTIAKLLLNDGHDLIHKATGWMLREAGKKDQKKLIQFLDNYAPNMPRTMLRYSIERLPEDSRKHYMKMNRTPLTSKEFEKELHRLLKEDRSLMEKLAKR